MSDWNKPDLSDQYAAVIASLKTRDEEVARGFVGVAASNLPAGVVRFNDTTQQWEKWSGTSWQPLASKYGIDVDKVDGFHASQTATANNVAVRDASANLSGNITGNAASATNADKVDGFHASQTALANNVAVRDANAKLAGDILGNAATATNADTVDGFHASQAATANNVAVRDASGNLAGNITGNAAYATSAGNADTVDGLHSSSFAAAAGVYLQRYREYKLATPGGPYHPFHPYNTSYADGREVWNKGEAVTFRAGSYGTAYLDTYDNYCNYANYANYSDYSAGC